MSVIKVAALAVLILCPVISYAEGEGEHAIKWNKSMQDGRMVVQSEVRRIDEPTVAEQQAKQLNDEKG
jgi:hypothetical protein